MIHVPCGRLSRNSACMSKVKCTKRYSRHKGKDGYPKYRIRSPENCCLTAKIRMRGNQEIRVDNGCVGPHNPLF